MIHSRRLAHNTSKSPALTGGDDQPRGACYDNPFWFDVALDAKLGSRYHVAAVSECKAICGSCDIRALCAVDYSDHPSVIAGKTLEERGARS